MCVKILLAPDAVDEAPPLDLARGDAFGGGRSGGKGDERPADDGEEADDEKRAGHKPREDGHGGARDPAGDLLSWLAG